MNRRSFGFTLIELLVTLAVLAIGLAITVPSFMEMIQKNRVTGATDALVADLQLTRMESIKRNHSVSYVPRYGGTPASTWCYGLDDFYANCDCTKTSGVGTTNCVVGNGTTAFSKVVSSSDFRDVEMWGTGVATFESVRGTTNLVTGKGVLGFTLGNYKSLIQISTLGNISVCSAGLSKLNYPEC